MHHALKLETLWKTIEPFWQGQITPFPRFVNQNCKDKCFKYKVCLCKHYQFLTILCNVYLAQNIFHCPRTLKWNMLIVVRISFIWSTYSVIVLSLFGMVFFPGIISFFNLNNRMSCDSTDPRDIIPPPLKKSLCIRKRKR